MVIYLHRNFKKRYKKLSPSYRKKFKERRDLFLKDPFHSLLHNHVLFGTYDGFRSINIGGDVRVLYEQIDDDTVLFITIGTHSDLYE